MKANTCGMPENVGIFFLRVSASLMMLTHGYAKFKTVLGDAPINFPDPLGIGSDLSLICAVGAEFFCSIFVILGVFTRIASLPIIFTMGVAVFAVHSGAAFTDRELPLLYLVVFIAIFFTGGGKLSVDEIIRRKF